MKTILKQDLKAIEKAKDAVKRNADKLNTFIRMAERDLKTTFTPAQKKNINEEGIEFINSLVRSKYKFPDANQDFNEKALGMNLVPLRKYYRANHLSWEKYSQKLTKDGVFVPVEVDGLPEVKRHTQYVENKKQEIALKQAKQLAKVLNRMQENEFITPYGHASEIEVVTKIVTWERIPNTMNYVFVPNLHNISLMK